MGNKKHIPVLLQETVKMLDPKPGEIYIDATAGNGGHLTAILEKIGPSGKALAIDQDESALANLREKNKDDNTIFVHGNFAEIEKLVSQINFPKADMILADVGFSSIQMEDLERGFSFEGNHLDMRMDRSNQLTAYQVVNTYSKSDLKRIFSEYGEERLSDTIAGEIVKNREIQEIKSAKKLSEIIANVYRQKSLKVKKHPATKVFQAIRMEVNNELASLSDFLDSAPRLLTKGGRFGIITFHSLEDRMVKEKFKELTSDCVCPPKAPVCTCNHKKIASYINKKPVIPSAQEVIENPRSRSAKLRIIEII